MLYRRRYSENEYMFFKPSDIVNGFSPLYSVMGFFLFLSCRYNVVLLKKNSCFFLVKKKVFL